MVGEVTANMLVERSTSNNVFKPCAEVTNSNRFFVIEPLKYFTPIVDYLFYGLKY